MRCLVGYDRFEGDEACQALTKCYLVLRLYVKYFQPSLKLISKEHHGARVTNEYDKAKTSYQRTLASSLLTDAAEVSLIKYYHGLDSVDRLKSRERLQDKLWEYGFVTLPVNAPVTTQSLIPRVDRSV